MPLSQFLSCWLSHYRRITACKFFRRRCQRCPYRKRLSSTKVEFIWTDDILHNATYFNYPFFRLNQRVSQHALRGQLIGYYNSLRSLLDDFPVIRDKYFIIGLPQGKKEDQDLKKNLAADPRFVSCLQACSWGPKSSV